MTNLIHFFRRNLCPLPLLCSLLFLPLLASALGADTSSPGRGPAVLPDNQLPNDARLQPLKDLDGYFPFQPSSNPAEWSKRAERVRQQILVSQGLWPLPTKTPLNAVIHGRINRPGYSVEKVMFESYPGFFVTGNLYRPEKTAAKSPAVLCPHGHWDAGRFHDAGLAGVRKAIVEGAERFEDGGRSPLQARCVELARLGHIVFHYDMIGYADSQQIPTEIAHGFAKQRPEMNRVEGWGLFSPQAEAHLQSVMGLQTWNSIRALDFLASLPEVDTNRIAVTGASGGGTQTFILGAIDPRPAVIFPAVMVSTAMQGGCTCENASGLRIGTGNVEFAALFAPKPVGLTAADDWTKEMPSKGFPELKQHYAMMGAPDNVMLKALVHFPHNYNYVSRAALYSWLNKQFHLGFEEPIVEEDYPRLTTEQMSVWDSDHPKPRGGPDFERSLLRWMTEDAQRQFAQRGQDHDGFQKIARPAVDVLIGRSLAEAGEVKFVESSRADRGSYVESAGLLQNKSHQEELPVVFLQPKNWRGQTVIWIDSAGKSGLYAEGSRTEIRSEARKLLDRGAALAGIDLFAQGEFLRGGQLENRNRRVKNPREFAAFTYGYNHPLFAERVHDILSLVQYVQSRDPKSAQIDLAGLNGAGPLVAAACAEAGRSIHGAAIDTGGFRFGKLLDFQEANFLPGGAKYGDLPGLLALGEESKLWIAGEEDKGREVSAKLSPALQKQLTVFPGSASQLIEAAAQWLAQP